MIQTVATHIIAFVLGWLMGPWALTQLEKFFKKND